MSFRIPPGREKPPCRTSGRTITNHSSEVSDSSRLQVIDFEHERSVLHHETSDKDR